MDSELNKSVLNSFFATLGPGAFILLYTIWGIAIFYPNQPNYYTLNELFFLFIFTIFAYIIGLLIEGLSLIIEGRLLKRIYSKNPSLVIVDANKHWLKDLDELYYATLKISLYELNKNGGQPKPGEYNGKKIDKYNVSQFERFASYILSGEPINNKLEQTKSKYILLRNLCLAFLICGLSGIIFFLIGKFDNTEKIIFYDRRFVLISSLTLFVSCLYLFIYFRKSRLEYLSDLFRYTRFYYLLNKKK